jgi:hypothetical protein
MISIVCCVLQNILMRLRPYLPYSKHDNGTSKQYKFVSGRPKTKDRFDDIGGTGKIKTRGGGGADNIDREDIAGLMRT